MNYTNTDLAAMHNDGLSYQQIADATGLEYGQVRGRIRRLPKTPPPAPTKLAPRLQASPYPRYENPLTVTGDALILNDLEVPFHHADFVNRCLDLCEVWGIKQLILGGDILHFEAFSAWGAAWQQEVKATDAISEETEARLRAYAERLPAEQQAAYLEEITALAAGRDCADDEIKAGAKALKTLAQVFDGIYYVLGNHDDRFLRKLDSPLTPQKLLDFLGLREPCWKIAPYYFGILHSAGQDYRIEHPRGAAEGTAVKQADIHESHVICAHSHLWSLRLSSSGKHYAIMSGCAVDETRLAYTQRDTNRPAHKLGAVIVREGVPYLLEENTPWKRYAMMK